MTHCLTFDVLGHLDGTLQPTGDDDANWHKRDGLVKLWIYGTLTEPLFKSSFKTGGTARDVWLRIENQFRNNKEARAIQLDNELRTTEIGDQTIQEYTQKLKSLADLLSNVDAPVNERTLVMYLLNGLNERYDNIINVIKHKEPFPSFDNAKSMLEMEEQRLKKTHKLPAAVHKDTSSSSSALTVTHSTNNNDTSNQPRRNQQSRNNQNNYRGNRRGNRYRGRGYGYQGRPNFNYWNQPQMWSNAGPMASWPNQFANWTPFNQQAPYRGPPSASSSSQRPAYNNNHQAQLTEIQPFVEAYTTESLPDNGIADWFMDSGATSHISNTAGNLSSSNKNCINHSIIVGNGSSIPVTSVGSSVLSTPTRPLSLKNVLVTPQIVKNLISVRKFTRDNWCSVDFDPFGFSVKDLLTKKTLVRCESSGDLYPLPASFNKQTPSTSTALLASSPFLWHKRLGHTNKSVSNSLVSSNSIQINKNLFPSSCEPCLVSKQTKLPFQNSHTQTTSLFQIVHSDVWSSPEPSISGLRYYVLFLDHYSHYVWVYPLRKKSEVFAKYLHFSAYVQNRFKTTIKSFQCDNGGEYNNIQFRNHLDTNGIRI